MDNVKIPPQAIQLEEAVLGAIMLDREAIIIASDILTPESFYVPKNAIIFSSCFNLYKRSEPIDLLTVTQELRSTNELEQVGGAYYVTMLTSNLTSAANVEFHARIIYEAFLKRQLIKISHELERKAYEDSTDCFELINETDSAIFNLTQNIGGDYNSTIPELYLQQIKRCENKKEGVTEGYLFGSGEIDNLINGLKKQELMIIAARPGMGKTAFSLTIAKNLSLSQNIPVAFFSLEMKRQALCSRFTSLLTDIPLNYLINSDVRGVMFTKMMEKQPHAMRTQLNIDDQGGITITQLRSKVRKYIKKYKVQVIFVDYLQKMHGENLKGKSKAQEIDEIASGLKNIAKEFDIPVIALAQLNRDVEKRENKRPQLSDLKESGGIEQEADIVAFIYRPEYYQIKEGINGTPLVDGYTEFIIEKNRNGALGTASLIFKKELTRFQDMGNTQYESTGQYTAPINYSELTKDELF